MLISFDGIDGCGKSTQVHMLAELLGAEIVREISPSIWGKKLFATENPTLGQQLAWFTADRALLSPRLAEASESSTVHIVTDRSYLSSVAYQSYDSPLSPELIEDMGLALMPPYDVQLILSIPVAKGLARVDSRGEARTWCESDDRLTHCAAIFEKWAATRERVCSVDADQTIEQVHVSVREVVAEIGRARFGKVLWE